MTYPLDQLKPKNITKNQIFHFNFVIHFKKRKLFYPSVFLSPLFKVYKKVVKFSFTPAKNIWFLVLGFGFSWTTDRSYVSFCVKTWGDQLSIISKFKFPEIFVASLLSRLIRAWKIVFAYRRGKKIMGDAISGQTLLKKKRCKHSIKIVQNMCSTNELTPHTDMDCRIVSKKDFQASFLGQGHLIAWHLKMLLNVFWIIKSRFLLFGTKLTRNQHENTLHFWWFFSFCPFYGQKMQERVSKS